MDSPAAGVTSAGAMRPFVAILWPLVGVFSALVYVGAGRRGGVVPSGWTGAHRESSGRSDDPAEPAHRDRVRAGGADATAGKNHRWNWVTFCDPATQRPGNPATRRPS